MELRKFLLWATLGIAIAVFSGAAVFQEVRRATPLAMNMQGFPTMGPSTAPIEVVLIEDFQCRNCRAFSHKVLPQLQKQYVKGGKVRFILVPVSFLAGSQLIANAVLEVYVQNPKAFFPYLKEVLAFEGDLRIADLMRLARRVNGINLAKLQSCIEKGCHQPELQKNLSWAQGVMGSQFRTPALYVNGNVGSTYSFEAIQYQIDSVLGKQ